MTHSGILNLKVQVLISRLMPNYSTDESDAWQSVNEQYRKQKKKADQQGDFVSSLGNEVLSNYAKAFRDESYENKKKKRGW